MPRLNNSTLAETYYAESIKDPIHPSGSGTGEITISDLCKKVDQRSKYIEEYKKLRAKPSAGREDPVFQAKRNFTIFLAHTDLIKTYEYLEKQKSTFGRLTGQNREINRTLEKKVECIREYNAILQEAFKSPDPLYNQKLIKDADKIQSIISQYNINEEIKGNYDRQSTQIADAKTLIGKLHQLHDDLKRRPTDSR